MAKLKLRFFDDDKVIAEQKGESINDFDNIMKDLKAKYGGRKRK
jgi:hypothetical protein